MEPDEFVNQCAKYWRETEKKLIAARDDPKAKFAHHDAKKKLRGAVDLACRADEKKMKGES